MPCKIENKAFSQQSIRGYQVISKRIHVLILMYISGILSIIFGYVLIVIAQKSVRCSYEYQSPASECLNSPEKTCVEYITITENHCKGQILTNNNDEKYIRGPVNLNYRLSGFYQNHRRYITSRNMYQLHGKVITDINALKDCSPAIISSDNVRILSPCGLAAKSFFNDSYAIFADPQYEENYQLFSDVNDIVWPNATEYLFKNPVLNDTTRPLIHEWLNETIFPGKVENAHFQVWMRNAPLPNFSKMYGVVKTDLKLPVYLTIYNRYPTDYLNMKKWVEITQNTWIGTRNVYLGSLYCAIGGILLICAFYLSLKNRKKPRSFGDITFLKWKKKI